MSGFVAVLERDVDRAAGLAVLGAQRLDEQRRGPDGCARWVAGPVALGYAHLHTAPRDRGETAPFVDAELGVTLCFDGRIDNREDLLATLELGRREAPVTDARLVARAYARWGLSAPEKLLGDFSFVIWDWKQRWLVGVRDPLGVRPFYYAHRSRVLALSTELKWLLADNRVPSDADEGMIGEYLACLITSRTGTLYGAISRLEPGHILVASERGLRLERYWRPESIRPLELADHREYVERFRETFAEAVRCRLQASGPVGLDLSGGVDSSSVVSVAADLCRKGDAAGAIQAFTLAYPGRECDETEFADEVVRRWGVESHRIVVEPPPEVDYAASARRHRDFPGHPNGLVATPALERARALGVRVMLGGVGSDELLSGATRLISTIDRVRRGQRRDLMRDGVPWRGLAQLCLRWGAERVIPTAWFEKVRRELRTGRFVPWLERAFVRRVHLVDRVHARTWAGTVRPEVERLERVTSGWLQHSLEIEERAAAEHQIEYRYPFLDRRMVELCLALPEAECVGKRVLRDALEGVLPERIRQRTTKAAVGHLFPLALQRARARAPLLSAIRRTGWIDAACAAERMANVRVASVFEGWALWMLHGIDLWCADHVNNQRFVQ